MGGESDPLSAPHCPYGDKGCPKVESVSKDISETKRSLADMARMLYLIAGILMVQLGVSLI